jgi:putative peptide zinc metalloprotease protein
MSERSTFSPFWHRVRTMRPRLRPHVQITRQHYRGRRWHVVHDPSSNAYFRLSPVGYEFVGLLDGQRSVEDVWQLGLTRHGDDALTQNEVIQLLSQLYNGNLLSGDTPPETEQLLGRGRDRVQKKAAQQAIGLMYFKVKLFNPDHILNWVEPIMRPVLNRIGFVVWAIWVIAAFIAIAPHMEQLASGFESAIAPSNWGWMIVTFILLKLWHELGHGVICKRFGGQVPEFGAMMLVLVPAPFVDASSAWTFPSKWQRMAVGAGGMIFELALAALAAFIWLNTKGQSTLVHQLAYNAMLSASVSTVLFNANPLMRFDGYYILSDYLEIPNLQQRSFNMLKFLFQKHVYRMRDPVPPTSSASEALLLLIYSIASGIYRIVLFVSITVYLVGQLFALGVILAAWTAAMWFILPMGQFVHWLATNQGLAERRGKAIATSLAIIAVGLVLIGLIPMPDHRRAVGVIESEKSAGVYFRVNAFVTDIHVKPGQRVKAGDPIVTTSSDQLVAQIDLVKAQIDEAMAREREARVSNEAAAQVAAQYITTLGKQLEFFEEQYRKLTVVAPQDGVVVGSNLHAFLGSYVQEGSGFCQIIEPSLLRATATLTQQEAWIYELPPDEYNVEVRRVSKVDEVIPAKFVKTSQAGDRELPHPALGFGGGGTFETETRDQTGRLAKSPILIAHFRSANDGEEGGRFATAAGVGAQAGERVHFRFTLPSKPWMIQWIDSIEKTLQGRARL